jgi:hypothetical protein
MRRYLDFGLAVLICFFLIFVPACGGAEAGNLKAGFARVDITCPVGIPLIGSYGKPSENILDPLYARAMVLDDGLNTIAIVSADLLYTPLEEITEVVRRIVKDKIGIPAQNILVCATHTHSGPEVFTRSKIPRQNRMDESRIDREYLHTLNEKIADSVISAYQNMRRVRIGVGKGQLPEIIFNRRTINAAGKAVMTFSITPEVATSRTIRTDSSGYTRVEFVLGPGNLKFGPVDPDLYVIRVEDMDGNIAGSILNFGCHPVCIYPDAPTTISADYPGDASGLVELTEGGICLFTLAPAGNIVPLQRGEKAHRQIGTAIAGEAIRQLQFVRTTDEVTLKALREIINLPVKKTTSEEIDNQGDIVDIITTEIQVLQIGDIYILAMPGEILVEIGLEIKKLTQLENLVIISLGNDTVGYVCHEQAYKEGGYEPDSGTCLAKGSGEIMIKEAMELISRIKADK